MDEDTVSGYVNDCALSVRTGASCRYRPAKIHALTVQLVGPFDVVVWVVTPAKCETAAGRSYRFTLRSVKATAYARVLSTVGLAIAGPDGVRQCRYWDIPGNVRDIALTAGRRALCLPWTA